MFVRHKPQEAVHSMHLHMQGPSIACSTPEACAWDPEWANAHEISGRAIQSHESSQGFTISHSSSAQQLPNGTAKQQHGSSAEKRVKLANGLSTDHTNGLAAAF